jgi:hypothetical protein
MSKTVQSLVAIAVIAILALLVGKVDPTLAQLLPSAPPPPSPPSHGVPGPIAGAGLPILAVGYGAYWLVRRYGRKAKGN